MTDKILPLHVEYRKMFDQPLSKSKDLRDMLRILPGVVVQHPVSMQGMADLYRIKPDLFECFIKFTIKDWQPPFHYKLSGFLQHRDCSQRYYCDPMLQHISICRHFFSLNLMDRSMPLTFSRRFSA